MFDMKTSRNGVPIRFASSDLNRSCSVSNPMAEYNKVFMEVVDIAISFKDMLFSGCTDGSGPSDHEVNKVLRRAATGYVDECPNQEHAASRASGHHCESGKIRPRSRPFKFPMNVPIAHVGNCYMDLCSQTLTTERKGSRFRHGPNQEHTFHPAPLGLSYAAT